MYNSALIFLLAFIALETAAQCATLSNEISASQKQSADPYIKQLIPSKKKKIVNSASHQLGTCQTNGDCDNEEICRNLFSGSCSSSFSLCFCIAEGSSNPFGTCSLEKPCDGGKVCAGPKAGNLGFCVTCDEFQNLEGAIAIGDNPCGTNDDICIDAKLLDHLPSDSLVFKAPRRAAVLCDVNGSCATPGHMVTYKNKPMMMSTYCKIVDSASCSRRVISVNSPRMTRALRIPSHTDKLLFTPLSAQYGSVVEVGVLSVLVHMGI